MSETARVPTLLGKPAAPHGGSDAGPPIGQNFCDCSMRPFLHEEMTALRVSARVNSPSYDGPECVAPSDQQIA